MPAWNVTAIARELMAAWTGGMPLALPPPSNDADFDLNTAYAVEAEIQRIRTEGGRRVVGRKVGYANRAMWRALKLETLVWASMYDDTVHFASDLEQLPVSQFISPRIEPEIVFKLKTPMLSGDFDASRALDCVEWLAAGFEIIDCPWPGWQFKPPDFVAAFGLHRALVVGEPCPAGNFPADDLAAALASFRLKLLKNRELVEEGSGKNSLRSPALCLAELAGAILRQPGAIPLAQGDLISTGTLTAAQPIAPGENWQARIEGLPLAGVEIQTV